MKVLLSNLERWLRENGSEMNEKCEFGFSSMMEEDNTLMIVKTRAVFSIVVVQVVVQVVVGVTSAATITRLLKRTSRS